MDVQLPWLLALLGTIIILALPHVGTREAIHGLADGTRHGSSHDVKTNHACILVKLVLRKLLVDQ